VSITHGSVNMARSRVLRLLLIPVLLMCLGFQPALAALPREQQEALLAEASKQFAQGAGLIEKDRAKGLEALDASITAFSRLVDEGGISNGRLFYNLANSYLLRGDLGRAILNYRRAERLMPGDPNLVQNLAYARSRVTTRIDAAADRRVRSALLFWHEGIPARVRFWAFALANAAAWGLGLLGLIGFVRGRGWWLAGGAGVVAAILGVSLGVDASGSGKAVDAVVTAQQVIGRKGPDENAYEPSFTEPLSGGVEARLVETRPGWTLLSLADGRQTWVPSSAAEAISMP
jgi:hypothetical protein